MSRETNTGKKLIISGLIVVVLLGLGVFLVIHFTNPWAREKIAAALKKLETGPMKLKYDSFNIDLSTGHFDIQNVAFLAGDSANTYQVAFKKLTINGLGLLPYLIDEKVDFNDIELLAPAVKLTRNKFKSDSISNGSKLPSLPPVLIRKLHILDGKFTVVNKDSTTASTFVSGDFALEVTRFEMDSTKTHRYDFFDLDDLKINLKDVHINLSDSMYRMELPSANVDFAQQSAEFDSFRVVPNYKKYELSRHAGHQTDYIDLTNPAIKISGINFECMFTDSIYHANLVSLDGLNGLIFRDRRLPFPDKPDTKLLSQFMSGVKIKVDVDTIKLKNASVEYQEYVKKSAGPGKVRFEDLFGTFYHFTNLDSVLVLIDHTARMDAQCKVMGKGLLKASFTFPLTNKKHFSTAKGSLSTMSLTELNPMIEYVSLLRIQQGQLVNLDFNFAYDNDSAAGTMEFEYKDLKISKLDKNAHASEGLGENIKTFIINTFLVKTDNLKNKGKFRVGQISFNRNKKKSWFNYWWGSLLSGFGSSTGISPSKEKINTN